MLDYRGAFDCLRGSVRTHPRRQETPITPITVTVSYLVQGKESTTGQCQFRSMSIVRPGVGQKPFSSPQVPL